MSLDWVAQAAPAVATFATAVFGIGRGQGRLRRNIRHDAETIEHLPEGQARCALLEHVEWQAKQLAKSESTGTRELPMFGFATVSALGLGYLTVWLLTHDDWWRWFGIVSGFVALIFLFGMFDSLARRDRSKPGDSEKNNDEKPTEDSDAT